MFEGGTLKLLIADPLRLVQDGLAAVCQAAGRYSVVAQASDGEQAGELIRQTHPDIAILDLGLERTFALELIRGFLGQPEAPKFVILSARRDRKTVLEALRGGAQGFVSKNAAGKELLDCLEQVRLGGVYVSPDVDATALFADSRQEAALPLGRLSAREYQVFTLLVEGVRAKEIAARLNVSPKSVDTYRANLMRKLQIHDVAGLVKYALQHHLASA